MATQTVSNNGQSLVENLVRSLGVPESIVVEFDGVKLTAHAIKVNGKEAIRYEAVKAFDVSLDLLAAERRLGSSVATYKGTTLNRAEVHLSSAGPRSKGGNPTVLHTTTTELGGIAYLVKVNATVGVRTSKLTISVNVHRTGGGSVQERGEAEGELQGW